MVKKKKLTREQIEALEKAKELFRGTCINNIEILINNILIVKNNETFEVIKNDK